jgi:hypothetical protein
MRRLYTRAFSVGDRTSFKDKASLFSANPLLP